MNTIKSEFGRFVLADVKKGDAAHAFRLQMIASAILEGYKGNPNGLTEAKQAAEGKSTIARAYQAGLASLPVVTKLAYVGAWARTENADIRKQAATLADEATGVFGAAFDAVYTAEKNAAKAKRDAKAAAQPTTPTVTPATDEQAIDVSDAVEAVTLAIQQGMLSVDELLMLRLALVTQDDTAPADLLTRTPALLMAQA
jgi:hypothetical protein